MIVDYNALPGTAKVWVYPSNRKFYDTEIEGIHEKIKTFLERWKSDDENFQVSYQFLYNRFIVFFADDSTTPLEIADIDASVQFILQLQQEHKVDLLDKMNVCFKQGEYVQYKDLKDFKKLLKNKAVTVFCCSVSHWLTVYCLRIGFLAKTTRRSCINYPQVTCSHRHQQPFWRA